MGGIGASRSEARTKTALQMLIVMAITFVLALFLPNYRQLFSILPLFYFFGDKILRKQKWSGLGFNLKNTPQDVVNNWFLILLVAIVIPVLITVAARTFFPQLLVHIKERLPFGLDHLEKAITTIAIAALGEEIIFRAFLQERLGWLTGTPLAIVLASLVFGLFHYSPGPIMVISFDIVSVSVDGAIYGAIFARTKNVYAAWFAHFVANLVAVGLLIF